MDNRASSQPVRVIVSFWIPKPPSSKNARRARVVRGGKANGRVIQYRPTNILRVTEQIRHQASLAMAARGWPPGALIEDNDIGVAMEFHVATEQLHVTVFDRGPKPKKPGRKSDLHNMQELVLDAMQGIVYRNDNQVSHLLLLKDYPQ